MTAQETGYTLGVDVGGTKIATALIDSAGSIIASDYRLIDSAGTPQTAIDLIVQSAAVCLKKSGQKASALGVGIAGQIDKSNGIVHRSPNLPTWLNVPLGQKLTEALKIPVVINNDVRAITIGEWTHGAGKGVNDLVCLIVGTGVGGGVVSAGQLLEGCSNSAGELGHITVVAGGRKCTCPNEGCLEAYVGGWAIAERARDSVRANPQAGQSLINRAGSVEKISAKTVGEAYHDNDPLAQRLIKDTLKYLAAGVVSIVNTFNPCLIVLGGSVIFGIPELVPAVEARVRQQALQTPVNSLRVVTAGLGNQAGVIGAATMARQVVSSK